ncbi:MAG TPA: imidazole glycerol phosphate synthase subunit HisH [Urbifossiella sp.]
MTSTVAIVDYGSGNLRSAEKALTRVAAEQSTGQHIVVTSDAEAVAKAERIVLPGVGAFADCMSGLSAVPFMVDVLKDAVLKRGVPFLGICVGMQLLADVGREFGDHAGLGWIGGEVVKIAPSALKIPHMGWNELKIERAHPLLANIPAGGHAYFVHSYHFRAKEGGDILATTDYGETLTAMIGRDNIAGTQFHPEKSQAVGLTLLANFLKWRP